MPELAGREVGPIGYGLMGLSWRPQPPPLDVAIKSMKTALDNGCTLWVGGEFYGTPEYNSMTILKEYFTKYPEDASKVTLMMKGGINAATHKPDGTAEGVRRSLDNMIAQLGGTKKIDIFNCARRDAATPLEVTFGTIQKEYIDTGKLGAIALSECGVQTIQEAVKHAKIALAELELSLFSTDILDNGIAAACGQHNITIVAYSPIGRGILAGSIRAPKDVENLGRIGKFPQFQDGALEHNLKLADQVNEVAEKKGCTSAQLAISWVAKNSGRQGLSTVIPIPGGSSPSRVAENSNFVELTEEEFSTLTDMANNFERRGERYPPGVPINT